MDKPLARPAPHDFTRRLPHIEGAGAPLFITFATHGRKILPEPARDIALRSILHDQGVKMDLLCAVVMTDHVHILYVPLVDEAGAQYTKTEIIGAVKSASAHDINKRFGRRGPVWQDESFDHVLRRVDNIEEKARYIAGNPVRKGLCRRPAEYPWLWINPGLGLNLDQFEG